MSLASPPTVSVCVLAYNHAHYIRQALDGILSQEVDFPIEVVVGEDCSTDATRAIVLEYQQRFPHVVRVLLPPENQGMNRNLVNTLKHCQGRYIALLEGDDYWTSPQKLKKQVAFLEAHPECTICFHKAEVLPEGEHQARRVWPDFEPPVITTLHALLKQNYIPTCSVMYRNIGSLSFPPGFFELNIGDWPLHVWYAQRGDIGFLNEVLACYRLHAAGHFSGLDLLKKTEAVFLAREFVYPRLEKKYRQTLGTVLLEYCYQLAQTYWETGNVPQARAYLLRGMRYLPHFPAYEGRNLYLGLCWRVWSATPAKRR